LVEIVDGVVVAIDIGVLKFIHIVLEIPIDRLNSAVVDRCRFANHLNGGIADLIEALVILHAQFHNGILQLEDFLQEVVLEGRSKVQQTTGSIVSELNKIQKFGF